MMMEIADHLLVPEGQAHLGHPITINAGTMTGPAGENFVTSGTHELPAKLLHTRNILRVPGQHDDGIF